MGSCFVKEGKPLNPLTSSEEYKKVSEKFLGEDARKMREVAATNAWELVLDNLPAGKKKEKKGVPQKGKGSEGAGENGDGRCVGALRTHKKTRQGDSEEKEAEIVGRGGSGKFAKRVFTIYKRKEVP